VLKLFAILANVIRNKPQSKTHGNGHAFFVGPSRRAREGGREEAGRLTHKGQTGDCKSGSLPVLKRLAHIPADLDFGRKLAMSTWFMPYGSLALR
jgi:hypothetical protein